MALRHHSPGYLQCSRTGLIMTPLSAYQRIPAWEAFPGEFRAPLAVVADALRGSRGFLTASELAARYGWQPREVAEMATRMGLPTADKEAA